MTGEYERVLGIGGRNGDGEAAALSVMVLVANRPV